MMAESSLNVGTAPEAATAEPVPAPSDPGRKKTLSPDHLAKLRAGAERWRAEHPEGRPRKPVGRPRKNPPRVEPPTSRNFKRAADRMPGTEQGAFNPGPAPKPPPFHFPRPHENQNASDGTPRLVLLSELSAVIDGMWPLLLRVYPTAHKEMVRPTLALATRGIRSRFFHTGDGGYALFEARQTPFVPELTVHAIFVVGVHHAALMKAAEKWAEETSAKCAWQAPS